MLSFTVQYFDICHVKYTAPIPQHLFHSFSTILLFVFTIIILLDKPGTHLLLSGPALTVGRLPRASGLRGPPSSKKGPQDVLATKFIC